MIAIADYGMGNRRSVEKALAHVGAESFITSDVRDASAIILPGVGAFPEAMRNLERTGLGDVLVERAQAGVPLLGICLGMQLLFEASTEHEAAEEFFRAVASAARLTLHIDLQAGTNAHHMIEACFKAFARALRVAVAIDPRETGVPSTKGTLTT